MKHLIPTGGRPCAAIGRTVRRLIIAAGLALPAPGLTVDARAEEPHDLVAGVIEALRGSDTAGLVRIALGPDGFDEARRHWAESETERLGAITDQDRAEFAGMIGMLTAPGAGDTLMAMIEPQLAEWGANLAALVGMLQGMGSMQIQQLQDVTEEERANLQAALQAAANWAATSQLASPDKARQAITLVTDAARNSGLTDLDDLARMSFDEITGFGNTLLGLTWNLLALYGLPAEDLLASMRPATLSNDGSTAVVRTTFDFLGTEQFFDTELANIDGRWVSASAREGMSTLATLETESGTGSGDGVTPPATGGGEDTLRGFFSTLETDPDFGAVREYLAPDLVGALELLPAERRQALLRAQRVMDLQIVSRFTMNDRSDLVIEASRAAGEPIQGAATLAVTPGGWTVESIQWQDAEPFDAAAVAMLGTTAVTGESGTPTPDAAESGSPHLGVMRAVQALQDNDLGALLRVVLGEASFEDAREHWIEQRATRLAEISDADRAGFAEFMGMLTAPGSEDVLMAMLEPQLVQWNANLAALVGMIQGMGTMQIQQMEGISDADRARMSEALQAAAQWAAKGDLTDPGKAREAIGMVAATARGLDVASLDRLASLEFEELLDVGGSLLGLVRDLLAHYNLPLERMLDSITAETVSNDGANAVVLTRFDFLGVEQSVETRLTRVDGEWVSADAAAGLEAMAALDSAGAAVAELEGVADPVDDVAAADGHAAEGPGLQAELDGNPFLQRYGLGLTVLEDVGGFVTLELTVAPDGLADAAGDGLDLLTLDPVELGAPADRLALTALQRAVGAVSTGGRQVMLVPPTLQRPLESGPAADAALVALLAETEQARDEALQEQDAMRQAMQQVQDEAARRAAADAERLQQAQNRLDEAVATAGLLSRQLEQERQRALDAEASVAAALARAETTESALAAAQRSLQEQAAAEAQSRQEAERRQADAQARSRDLVQRVQSRLAALGYAPGPADGVAGAGTRNAIREYQANAGLVTDGEVSEALLEHMLSDAAVGPETSPPAPQAAEAAAVAADDAVDNGVAEGGDPGPAAAEQTDKPTLKDKASGLFNKLMRRDQSE